VPLLSPITLSPSFSFGEALALLRPEAGGGAIEPPTNDFVAASEPPSGSSVVPGVPNSLIGDIGRIIVGGILGGQPGGPTAAPQPGDPFQPGGPQPVGSDPLGLTGQCPGLFEIRGPDGTCINLGDLLPGGDPAITGQQPTVGPLNGAAAVPGFGGATFGRFGVGVVPRVEVQTVRRCPAGMALGKDGICYDGLGRNSPKRQWPMGMKPLLTPGDRNAIRVAGAAANKLARSKKSLKKAARALEKVC